jgi:hypothetical protein
VALVIPQRAGAQQSLRGREPKGWGSQWSLDLVGLCAAGTQECLRGKELEEQGSC